MVTAEPPVLRVTFDSAEALATEIENNLQHGRLFVTGVISGCEARAACRVDVMIAGGTRTVTIEGEVVLVQTDGAGVQFVWDKPLEIALRALLDNAAEKPAAGPGNVHEKIRGLSSADQQKMARDGSIAERVALERRYGKAVWETLLGSGKLTPPEVARIARNGTLPRPLVENIVANQGWLASPEVRRALLSNPRCTGAALTRVLRALPAHELKQAAQQTAYPRPVRNAAQRLLGKG